ncbi:PREDICTED: UPF0488 protein CG14286 [Nicrophorus vespilloides]|uniref:UPF0488 protein CG14286 n=1 Tax=Nicrophorus vespilloides TaxID=110193 RepID=A0ABM1M6K9_NICVS|nr:PREDICTED: UPF0488 protein CG14286 [Nicrophorus vespilloides]
MPPKRAPPKAKPPKIVDSSAEDGNSDVLDSEMVNQFQLELCWCIQNLQQALASGKLSSKQVQDHTKALNTLMNNAAPLVKRRQVMRLSFGDYRKKMAEDAKKFNKVKGNITLKAATPSTDSMFLKKSAKPETKSSNLTSDLSNLKLEVDNEKVETKSNDKTEFSFKPSNNSFQFNFNIEENK